jgi:putative membrane protein
MKRFATGAAIAVLCVPAAGLAETGSAGAATTAATGKPSAQDIKWMKSNAQTDLAEISAGKLVQSKSRTPGVLRLAKVTETQHAQVLAKLRALAQHLKVTLPTSPNTMQQAQAAALKKLSGVDFDTTYDLDQIAGHKLSISQTETEIKKGTTSTVVGFAKTYLPTAEMHLKMAVKLKAAKVK